MEVGAKVVGVGTLIIDQGLEAFETLRRDFHRLVQEMGINLTEVIGSAVKNDKDKHERQGYGEPSVPGQGQDCERRVL